jgi:hypothetical protein
MQDKCIFHKILFLFCLLFNFEFITLKKKVMSNKKDTFFDESTAAVGVIYTIALLGIIISILIWG